MSTGWVAVLLAGLLEVAWAHSIRLTDGFTRFVPTIACGALTVVVMCLLNIAMRSLPVGTAYAVFVGIGTVGTIAIGIAWRSEPATPLRMLALLLIVSGAVLLQVLDRDVSTRP